MNIGVVVPFDLGSVEEVDFAADNSRSREGQKLLLISDVYVRKLEK